MKRVIEKMGVVGFFFILFLLVYAGATNFDRIVLGSGNYGSDPNSTADITLQNDEYISNSSDGTISFGSAILSTSGALSSGTIISSGDISGVDLIADSAAGEIKLGVLSVGTASFTTTDTEDTVVISGSLASDLYFLGINDATPVANDELSYTAVAGSLFVHRPAGTTSGLAYSWLRIKSY